MLLKKLDLTTALRPNLLPEETLLFVQDAVGLYDGKTRLSEYQNGHAYLTSHRACYVGNEAAREYAVSIDLKEVDKTEFYAGFLKSSPKVTLVSKPDKQSSLAPNPVLRGSTFVTNDPARSSITRTATLPVNATWVCPICGFSNPVPSNFDPATANARTPIPPCLACGIKPPLVVVIKAAVNALSKVLEPVNAATSSTAKGNDQNTFECARCTFQNHPSLLTCEMCGASLLSTSSAQGISTISAGTLNRVDSPGPKINGTLPGNTNVENFKFSFRAGGEKIFHERLKNALVQRKWLLESAPPPPKPITAIDGTVRDVESSFSGSILDRNKIVGIAGLERRDQETRKNNETIIGNAFEDLQALMMSAKEVIALAEKFSSQAGANGDRAEANAISRSASSLGLITTKDMLSSSSESLYINELSRNLAELLTDDSTGILKREGGIMSLVDLWAMFNRARGGVELVSPLDFEKAARSWDRLKLPVRLRSFRSGLLVVQGRDRTDEKTIDSLLAFLQVSYRIQPVEPVTWDWRTYGCGVTAQEVASHFGWSLGVAVEELEMAEEQGALCREQDLSGIRFWENWLTKLPVLEA